MGKREKIEATLTARDKASPAFGKLSGAIAALGAAAIAAGGIALGKKLVDGILSAAAASGIQETAEVKLAQSIRLAGQSVDEVLPKLKEQASALQDLTGVGDETILSAQALLVTMGKLSGEGLERATKAALDMAAVTGSVETAFDLVSKASVGYTSTLSRYGIILDKSIPEAEKFGAALTKIEELFGGQAQTLLRTYEGRLTEVAGRFGDLNEMVGGPFREIFTSVLGNVVSPFIKGMTDAGNDTEFLRSSLLLAAAAALEFSAAVVEALTSSKLLNTAISLTAKAFLIVNYSTVAVTLGLLSDATGDAAEKQNALAASLDASAAELRKLAEEGGAERVVEGMNKINVAAVNVGDTLDKVKQKFLTVFVSPSGQDPLRVLGESLDLTRIDFSGVFDEVVDDAKKAAEEIEGIAESTNQFAEDAAAGVQTLAGGLADAATGAEVEWSSLIRGIIKGLIKAQIEAALLGQIMGAVNSSQGSSGGGSGSSSEAEGIGQVLSFAGLFFKKGGIIGAQRGMMVSSGIRGKDTQLIAAGRGEAMLPEKLTTLLMKAAEGGGSGGAQVIIQNLNLQSFAPSDFKSLAEDNPEGMGAGVLSAIEKGFL